jgi:hypothetical protein
MLMLVVVSFNPNLFLALILGYFAGDYVCCDFYVNMKIGVYSSKGGLAASFLRRLLYAKERGAKSETAHLLTSTA